MVSYPDVSHPPYAVGGCDTSGYETNPAGELNVRHGAQVAHAAGVIHTCLNKHAVRRRSSSITHGGMSGLGAHVYDAAPGHACTTDRRSSIAGRIAEESTSTTAESVTGVRRRGKGKGIERERGVPSRDTY